MTVAFCSLMSRAALRMKSSGLALYCANVDGLILAGLLRWSRGSAGSLRRLADQVVLHGGVDRGV